MFTQMYINLSELAWDQFLDHGFIIQRPETQTLVLGYGHHSTGDVEVKYLGFFANEKIKWTPEFIIECSLEEFINFLRSKSQLDFYLKLKTNYDDHFISDAQAIIDEINHGKKLHKLVGVTRATYFKDKSIHPLQMIKDFNKYPMASIYGVWGEGSGILGFSPEPLFVKTESGYKTKALAGTISTSISDYEEQILNDEKEIEEHQLVIEDISEKIKTIGKIQYKGDTHVFNFGNIAHLQTLIHFKVNDGQEDNIGTCFSPTAALGGHPSSLVYDHLKKMNYFQFDKDDRVFGGVLSLKDGLKSEHFGLVAIRNIQWNPEEIIIDSGCGIVGASDASKELKEVQRKRKTIEDIFDAKID